MKTSKYNLLFQDPKGNHYAFNGLSGGLLKLSEGVNQRIQEILNQLDNSNVTLETDGENKLFESLRKGCFILDDEVDELEILKARNRLVRFSGNRLYLTIVTNYSCNFRCTYCFEEHSSRSMMPDIQHLLVDFIKTSLKSCKELNVHWYGGEPLLCFPMIKNLSSQFKEICSASNCHYSASMSTNGFLLKEKTTAELSHLGVENINVTLDGPPDIHDKRRPLINGHGTFETILNNVVAATKYATVILRVNIDRNNITGIPELLDILVARGLGKKVLCNFVPVAPLTSTCQGNCFSVVADSELRNVTRNVSKEAMNRGIGLLSPSLVKARHCSFDDVNSFLIDTDGKMYKCFIEEKRCIGQLDNSDPRWFKLNYLPWVKLMAIDPLADPECRKCRVLPLCMGGCTFKRLKFGKESACPVWKNYPEEYILHNVAAGSNQTIPLNR